MRRAQIGHDALLALQYARSVGDDFIKRWDMPR
eukprot:CAMPEP_0195078318 /NCGR_PEP_ID=MMETSP0448-20130528/20532_1 /TAXON_ID=66468 /ORGANISM="Heterocapsa triquestra, Strain CCMP 448" /LENGTH=32 /DNA_ID= /DNA_START= /DNA_END= /DNA_ORIENTATION=